MAAEILDYPTKSWRQKDQLGLGEATHTGLQPNATQNLL